MITVYVLQGKVQRYIGITNNLSRRLSEHRRGKTKSTQALGEFSILHTEDYPDHKSARNREKFLKSSQGRSYLDRFYKNRGFVRHKDGE